MAEMDAPNSKIWKHPYGRRRRGVTFTDRAGLNALAEEIVSVNCLNCMGESLYPFSNQDFIFSSNITTLSDKAKEKMIFF